MRSPDAGRAMAEGGTLTRPVIVEVALNGVTPRSANPHVPREPAEITADALACVAAGATVVHNHTDDPMWAPGGIHAVEPYLAAWRPLVAAHPGLLLYATLASGGAGVPIAQRWAHHEALAGAGLTQMGLVDPGSVSLGGLDADGLPGGEVDRVYVNSHHDARHMLQRCRALGLVASVSIFDPSFLRTFLAFHAAGAVPHGALVKLYFGDGDMRFGLPPTASALDAYLELLDGAGLPWLVAVLGGDVVGCGLADAALARGGHVRVGLEDHAGPRTPTNAELVGEAVVRIEASGRRVATLAEARETLGLGARASSSAA